MNARSTAGLMIVVTVSWLLILGETYVFFAVVRPFEGPLHQIPLISMAIKIGLTAGLAVLWIAAMFALLAVYNRVISTVDRSA